MEAYSINDLEHFTGIKAHTIRIWEKRYKTLIPHRTSTRIRYYDDEQLRKLLNISVLLQQGHKISKLMALPDAEINKLMLKQVDEHQEANVYSGHISSLISSMLTYDEPLFDKVFSTIFIRFGVYESMINVVYPFLKSTGILWSAKNATPAQEHFASNIIKRKLLVAIDAIPIPRNSTRKFLLFLPPDEWHDIGLLFSDYVIRKAGMETVYLGQSVPYASISSCVQKVQPDYLLTFFTASMDFTEHNAYLESIATANPNIKILISGRAETKGVHKAENVTHISEPARIFDYLEPRQTDGNTTGEILKPEKEKTTSI